MGTNNPSGIRYYKTTVILLNWTEDEINTLDQINKNWSMSGQIIKRGND